MIKIYKKHNMNNESTSLIINDSFNVIKNTIKHNLTHKYRQKQYNTQGRLIKNKYTQ